jgi:hypothetical protein
MRRGKMAACLLVLLGAMPLSAQETASPRVAPANNPFPQFCPIPDTNSANPERKLIPNDVGRVEAVPWQTVWGLLGLRAIPAGPKTAPNGLEYHPNFSLDLNFNCWLWRDQGFYLFADTRLWGERGENGVTNGRDGWLGTSKRQFDLSGGGAWNYAGFWEARAFGYTQNNLNRGFNLVAPAGFHDGFGLENRYYLSLEYEKLGQTGFDVTRANFVSIGYFPSKDMVGNNGDSFRPGLLLRAYLTCDLGDWPFYVYGDASYISERYLRPRLLLFDLGLAARPFRACRQCEFRFGAENTGDFQAHNVQNLWYVSLRYIF